MLSRELILKRTGRPEDRLLLSKITDKAELSGRGSFKEIRVRRVKEKCYELHSKRFAEHYI